MKILAIRARNLASLPSFELDLEHGPLARTRIFAITGPTGAGKSTLLDALCLALYDRAPRLLGARDVVSQDLEVPATDPRSLMRRGAADALAEVDFLGNDARRYRATWEVWRARRRPDGKLQGQRMRLAALDGDTGRPSRRRPDPDAGAAELEEHELTGATKTETLARIEAKIGLSFAEFRRAVLLAQGDFAAFLEARPDQRAELLEKMTGTEIYGEISRAAFARAKAEEDQLRRLEEQEAASRPLAPEARASLEAEREALIGARPQLDRETAAARAAVTWHEEQVRLEAECREAEDTAAEQERALAQIAPDRRLLQARARAELLLPVFEAAAESKRLLGAARERASAAELARNGAAARSGTEVELRRHAEAVLQQAAEELAVRRPELAAARALDVRLTVARREHQAAAVAAAEVRSRAEAARVALALAINREEEARAELEGVDAWLRDQAGTGALAAEWPRWQVELQRLARATEELRGLDQAARDAELRAEAARATFAAREQERARLERELEARASAAEEARARLLGHRAKHPPGELQEALTRLVRELASIETMKAVSAELRRLSRQLEEEEELQASSKRKVQERRESSRALRDRRRELEGKVAALRDERDRVEAARDLASRRAELLTDGEPCPLCGSLDHPAIHVEPTKPAAARSVKRRLERAEDELGRVLGELSTREAEAAAATEAIELASKRAADLVPELELRRRDWRARAESIELLWVDSPILAARSVRQVALLLPEGPEAKGAATDLDKARARLEHHRDGLGALLVEGEALAKAAAEAAAEAELAGRASRDLGPKLEAARADDRTASRRAEELVAERSVVEARRTAALVALRAPLGELLAAASRDPAGTTAQLEAAVHAYEARRARRTALFEELRVTSATLGLTRAEDGRSAEELGRAEARVAERSAEVAGLEVERAALLGGRDAAIVEEALVSTLERADREEKHAAARANEAHAALAVAVAEARRASELAAELEEREALAEARLEEELSRSTLLELAEDHELGDRLARHRDHPRAERPRGARALVTALLELPQARLAEIERRLTHLERELEIGRARLADRRARRHGHQASAPALSAPEAARARLLELEARLRDQLGREVQVAHTLAADDAARAKAAALGVELLAQKRRLLAWAELSAVIGSADGKKLRSFAQGLSLDLLIRHANVHLGELRPRYRLQRAEGHDMELAVIDGDMGDELRAVATLSGGETFLVSLALALGLSSLSAKEVSIRSLFIDEGFGSLDSETLEVALAALDRLQAEGRTIGLVSHVPELAERIGYRVHVQPIAPGRSEVTVMEA